MATSRKSGGNRRGTRRSFGSVRKLPSGRFQARFTHPESGQVHRAPTTFDTRGAADAWLAEQRTNIKRGEFRTAADVPKTTLAAYADVWLANRPRALKPRTLADYRGLLDKVILPALPGASAPALGTMLPKDITPSMVSAWYAAVGSHRPVLRAHAYSLLKSIMASAVDEELAARNPCRIKGAASSPQNDRSDVYLTGAELEGLVAALPERLRALTLLSAWCGLRFGEATALTRRDVDLTNGVVHVRRAVSRVNGEAVVGTPKSRRGRRDVHIPPHIVPVLRDHMAASITGGQDGLVFPSFSDPTRHLPQQSVWRLWKNACAAIDRPDLHWHDLRHVNASMLAEEGATVKELMGHLGHTTPAMSLRYVEVASGRMDTLAARLSERAGRTG